MKPATIPAYAGVVPVLICIEVFGVNKEGDLSWCGSIEVGGRNWQNVLRKDLQLVPLSRRGIDREKPIVRAELNLAGQRQSLWLRGTLKLTKVEAEKGVEGSYDFSEPGERKWKGGFKARWTKGSGGCG